MSVQQSLEKSLEAGKIYIWDGNELIIEECPKSGYGESSIIWVDGEVVRTDTKETKKYKRGKLNAK